MQITHTAVRSGRLSSFLRGEMGISAGLFNRLKWQNKLLVNGIPRFADYPVQIGDVICVSLDEPAPDYPAQDDPITVLYEDEHILAVDKPCGMLIHPSHSQLTGTLANRVIGYYRRTGQNSAFHPITRLDRDTFGIVLLAKNAHIHALLSQLQREQALEKTYHALVYGRLEHTEGVIDAPIARKPLPSLLREVHPDGKPCRTEYTVLEQLTDCCKLALRPITGRTHQLRLHCAYIGHPILGDPQYNTADSVRLSQQLGLETQLLCAKQIHFRHPVTDATLCLRSGMDVSVPFPKNT